MRAQLLEEELLPEEALEALTGSAVYWKRLRGVARKRTS